VILKYFTNLIKALLFDNTIPEHVYVFALAWSELK